MKNILNILLVFTAVLFIAGCGSDEEDTLRVLNTFDIDVPEPSGLDFTADKKGFWTVSDKNSRVYLMDLRGNITDDFQVDAADIEAVAVLSDNLIAVVSESDREIILLNNNGKEQGKYHIDGSGDPDSGPEGFAYDPGKKEYFVANEKSPKVIIKLDSTFHEINRFDIKFADDLSGLYIDDGYLWVLSDESRSITKCTLSCEVINSWKIDVKQPEGLAVDTSAGIAYVVSDSESKLYALQLP